MSLEFDLKSIDGEQLGKLLDMLAQSDVEECELEQGDRRISLRRAATAHVPRMESAPTFPTHVELPVPEDSADSVVRAPAVGIFHRAEKRPAPPRVEPGTNVKVGDILGYIEVMRIPHSVASTSDGVLESFLVEDGQPVEYGQPLVTLR